MRDVEISDEAVSAALAVRGYGTVTREKMRELLAAAAPLLLKAEVEELADGLCCGGELRERVDELTAIASPAAVTPEPAGPRVWGVGEKVPADVLRIRDESGCLWSRDGAAWVHSCQDLGAVRSRMADSFLRCSVRTEVPAVPPAEPGAGA